MQSGVIKSENNYNNDIDYDFPNEEREVPNEILQNQLKEFEQMRESLMSREGHRKGGLG